MLCATLVEYLDNLLVPDSYQDFQPNGLQVAGKAIVRRIVTGVSANQALIDAAVALEADALLVHHGFFWKNEAAPLTGIRYRRIASLIQREINLISYHLPLDGHEKFGNNVQLAQLLGLREISLLSSPYGKGIGLLGQLPQLVSTEMLVQKIAEKLGRVPLLITESPRSISTIAWCTGAGESLLFAAKAAGADAFLTGEISERTPAIAKELGVALYVAGHHATERYGVQALGKHLADTFQLTHNFVDIENPV